MSQLITVCKSYLVGKPADIMDKSNIDWFPTVELGHSKINMASLKVANQQAARTDQRNKRILETQSSRIQSDSADLDTAASAEKEVQTENTVVHTSNEVIQTLRPT